MLTTSLAPELSESKRGSQGEMPDLESFRLRGTETRKRPKGHLMLQIKEQQARKSIKMSKKNRVANHYLKRPSRSTVLVLCWCGVGASSCNLR